MHLCIVTETFPPEINGVAMTLDRVLRGMREKGHRSSVVRPRQPVDKEPKTTESDLGELLVPGLPIPQYHGLQFGIPSRNRMLHQWSVQTPDIVYIATEGPLGLAAISAAKKLKIPVVSGFHTNFNRYLHHYRFPGLNRLALGYLRWVHNRTLATFTPSQDSVKELAEAGLKNVRLFTRGVDTQLFRTENRDLSLRESWGSDDKAPVGIYVSRIAPEKNLPLAVASFRELQTQAEESRCVFVGDGPALQPTQKAQPDFIYAGMRRGPDLARHYASADLFIFPSLTETFGNVVTEAMASGLVVVAFDYAAPRQLIRDGENGFLAKFGDEADFLKTLRRALREQSRWPEIRQAARTTAEANSWSHVIDSFITDLRDFIK